ncbi:MAG TPA: glycosyltransferase family 39 protein [Vicinamibacterales bacterium]|nr:glycosyltransferase family 39 protein [Vicinamibacterales bacterium]
MVYVSDAPVEVPARPHTSVAAVVRQHASVLSLTIAIVVALACRTTALATYGLSEDEVAKLQAIESYRDGRFSANAEHPMLMKLAMWASLNLADSWNAHVPPSLTMTTETALRLPNALAGTATVAAVYGVSTLLFGPVVAAIAAFILALDPTVIALNRIGKEDTFLMLFLMLGVLAYETAKRIGADDPMRARRWYDLSGISFGLMLASKYMPHFFGMYALFNVIAQRQPGANRPRVLTYNCLIGLTFLAANFAILLPSTWAYCLAYVRGDGLLHTGYVYDGRTYVNATTAIFAGVPVTYYLDLLMTKLPIPVLAGAALALPLLVSRRRERGFVWLRVFLIFTLLPYSLLGAKFQRYALPMFVVTIMLAAVGLVGLVTWLWRRPWPRPMRLGVAGVVAVLAFVPIVMAPVRAAPYYSVQQNLIGAAHAAPGVTFPEEAYDFGIREAVQAVAAVARPHASVVSDASRVTSYYLARSSRPDLKMRSLSTQGFAASGEQWVFVQPGHIYFENAALVTQLRQSTRPWRQYHLAGTPVLEVFRLER